MRLLLLLLLLACVSFAGTSCLDFQDATQTILAGEGTNIGLVLMLTVLMIAAAYMVGQATNNPSYTVFAKDEAYHLGFSVVILLGIGSILVFSCMTMDMFFTELFKNMAPELSMGCYSQGDGMNKVSSCYLNKANEDARWLSQKYISKYIEEMMESTFAWTIQWPLLTSYTSTAEAYRRVVSSQYDIILNSFLIPALMSISMQKLALDFINKNVIEWVLPSAFFLRIFMPTRQMGNALIALVIALYVIVPFMYVFNLAMYDVVGGDCSKFAEAVCDNAVDDFDCANTCANPLGFWNVGKLIPQAFFLPNLTIAVVITFLSSINKALRAIG